jgi:hypothetical protein
MSDEVNRSSELGVERWTLSVGRLLLIDFPGFLAS